MLQNPIKKRLFLTFVLFGTILVFGATLIGLYHYQHSLQQTALENAKSQFIKDRDILQLSLSNAENKLIAIQRSKIFQRYLQDQTHKNFTQELFFTLVESSSNIYQLRFIDLEGKEKIKVERKAYGAIPYIVQEKQLQNKKERYYVQKLLQLYPNEVWISNIDLNIEHHQIQKPYIPVIRIGMPVYIKQKIVGILVLNIFMQKPLELLQSSKLYDIYLIDKDGYFLLHKDPKYNWSRYKEPHVTLKEFFPTTYKQILHNDIFEDQKLFASTITLNNPDHLKIIVVPTETFLETTKKEFVNIILVNITLLILLAIPVSLLLAKPYIQLQQRLRQNNKKLRQKVHQITKKYKELNKNLEQTIQERTKEQNILLSLFDLGDAVLFKWNNDEHWSVASVSKSVEKLLGYSAEEFKNGTITYSECIYPEDLPQVIKEVENAVEKQLYFFTHEPYRVLTKSKATKWIHDQTVIVRNEEGEITHFVGYLIDITAIKENELKLQHLSITDKLTQIYNRLYLDETLQNQYMRLKRYQEPCSIILMDIDHFKKVNDTYGHLVGDKILQEITQLIQKNLRKSDIFGRWGGEEFMIIAPHTPLEEALQLTQKLQQEIRSYSFKEVGKITVSFGVTECSLDKSLDENITTADKALYASKENGRDRITTF